MHRSGAGTRENGAVGDDQLGTPVSRNVQRLPNRHDPSVTDERIELRYDGAIVTLHTVPKYSASFLSHQPD
jgi:hypothetical protein